MRFHTPLYWKFLDWLIASSLIYFSGLCLLEATPSNVMELYGVVMPVILMSIGTVFWWFSWRWFEQRVALAPVSNVNGGDLEFRPTYKNPAMSYYTLVLKFFLLALGLNGVITLDQHEGGWRTFYIWNCVACYLYALPMLFIKIKQFNTMRSTRLLLTADSLTIANGEQTTEQIPLADIQSIKSNAEGTAAALLVDGRWLALNGPRGPLAKTDFKGLPALITDITRFSGKATETVDDMKAFVKENKANLLA